MDILKELFYGKLNPYEKRLEQNDESRAIQHKLSEVEDKLLEDMTYEKKILYDECFNYYYQLTDISDLSSFIEGFRTGARLIIDIYKNEN